MSYCNRNNKIPAPGAPGIEPRWTRGNKDGIGTAYSADSRLWFTLWSGIVTEVYYPTVDRPQLRDLQYLVTDEKSFFHEEKRNTIHSIHKLADHALGYKITNSDPEGRYTINKEVISDPHLPTLLLNTRFESNTKQDNLKLYVLCAPHLEVGGWGNSASIEEISGRRVFVAHKKNTWMVMGASTSFGKMSCGYVGKSDGWTDIASDFKMDWQYEEATDGNIALTAEVDASKVFTIALSFGETLHQASAALFGSLSTPFGEHKRRFLEQWDRSIKGILPLQKHSPHEKDLYHSSYCLILAHEDKSYPGAIIASLSIPWGETRGDDDQGGYHLVWTRDLVQAALGLLAAGDSVTPLRVLVYLAVSQLDDGRFPQNFWIDGTPYWRGVQLDEASFPIILAWKLKEFSALGDFDPYSMVMKAAAFIIKFGPATQQDRWEEVGGYSPSTLASNIAALCCAADFARERGDLQTAEFLQDYSDFLESHVEQWTVTKKSSILPEVISHYIRVQPYDENNPDENPDDKLVSIPNRPPGSQTIFKASEIVDAGFLELVRFGIRNPDFPLITQSLRVIDALLKVDTPYGPCWRRYNHDGYGQRDDGTAFRDGWGRGRCWPLLTAERGNYEFALGKDVSSFILALEGFSSEVGFLPEQVWDMPDIPERHMKLGRATGSAMPLVWAHAEYIKLLRSVHDRKPFDRIDCVYERYSKGKKSARKVEIWKSNRKVQRCSRDAKLKFIADEPFTLHYSFDRWKTVEDINSSHLFIGIDYVAIEPRNEEMLFTFYWPKRGVWEGRDYQMLFE